MFKRLFPQTSAKKIITLYVCRTCDRTPAKMETPAAEGSGFLATLKTHFATHPHPTAKLSIRPVKCLGGCEASMDTSKPNGCCSVAFTAPGRFSYVLNRFNPAEDAWKVAELLRLYLLRPNGRIQSKDSPHKDAIKSHIATRVPPFVK